MVVGHDIVREFNAFLFEFFNYLGQIFLLGRHGVSSSFKMVENRKQLAHNSHVV
jgi:hypothetical protein